MSFQIKGNSFQIKGDVRGNYDINWAIRALKIVNLVIGLIIWVDLTFIICYYTGLLNGVVPASLIPEDPLPLSLLIIVSLFIPILINRVAMKDLEAKNKPCTLLDLVKGE